MKKKPIELLKRTTYWADCNQGKGEYREKIARGYRRRYKDPRNNELTKICNSPEEKNYPSQQMVFNNMLR